MCISRNSLVSSRSWHCYFIMNFYFNSKKSRKSFELIKQASSIQTIAITSSLVSLSIHTSIGFILLLRLGVSMMSQIVIEYCYDQHLLDTAWTWAKNNDDMIGCAASISVSASCSRCNILALASWIITCFPHVLWMLSSWNTSIYSIDTALYSLHFTIYSNPLTPSQVFA